MAKKRAKRKVQRSGVPEHVPKLIVGQAIKQLPAAVSLGAAALKLGEIVGRDDVLVQGARVHYENAVCSCAGMNSSCYKCDGTGYYSKAVITSKRQPQPPRREVTRSETSFASDSRGGIYGIREHGRFASAPDEDDYDN